MMYDAIRDKSKLTRISLTFQKKKSYGSVGI